jgi:hypothetical protein
MTIVSVKEDHRISRVKGGVRASRVKGGVRASRVKGYVPPPHRHVRASRVKGACVSRVSARSNHKMMIA